MVSTMNRFETLSTRSGFNSAVRHIKGSISLLESLAERSNLGDLLFERMDDPDLKSDNLSAIVRMVLVDKFGYACISRNLRSIKENLNEISTEVSKWDNVDLIVVYHHPDVGLIIANPKSAEQLEAFGSLRKRELAVVYAGRLEKGTDALCPTAAELVLQLMEGLQPSIPATLYKGVFTTKKVKKTEAQAPKVAAGKKESGKTQAGAKNTKSPIAKQGKNTVEVKVEPAVVPVASAVKAQSAPVATAAPQRGARMTPMYSVIVQNELFHNGNVEAWKRIIASYKEKNPNLEVHIYYDGERIVNINSLFKWGKVKHGSSIQFAVSGDEIKDVAKLQRYLIQGASHMFESFLHGPVSTVLKLF